jgi:hypothetical protein
MRSALVVLGALVFATVPAGCDRPDAKTPDGSIGEVVVVLKGSAEPLHFDPRGSRITIVTQEIKKLVGHHVVLELDTALSPGLKASLEETVLASFENFARELVLLQREDPDMFAKARLIERIVCRYDAVAKESEGALEKEGTVLAVRAPPDRFPLLEKWIVSQAVYDAHVRDLDARWGDVDPAQIAQREQPSFFAYMTKTRPAAGYLWVVAQRKKRGPSAGTDHLDDDLRLEHIDRILRFANVVEKRTLLRKRVRHFLLENAGHVGEVGQQNDRIRRASPAVVQRVVSDYEAWFARDLPEFDDDEHLLFATTVFEERGGTWRTRANNPNERHPPPVFAGFDRFAYGLSIYDAWAKEHTSGQEGPIPDVGHGPRGALVKTIICPQKRRGEGETEIRTGCSPFFSLTLRDDAPRGRLAEIIVKRRDRRLLEMALLNLGHGYGGEGLALVEALKDEALFHDGFRILFHDLARRDDVKDALEKSAVRWWRDAAARRGLALLVFARQWEHLHVHYGDNQWTRFVAEFGGPVARDVFASYLAEGARAVEMTPKIWLGLAKGPERDELTAKSLPLLFTRDREARSSRARSALTLLRARLCTERNAHGLELVRAVAERWAKDHPDDTATVANARNDFTLARCAKPVDDER